MIAVHSDQDPHIDAPQAGAVHDDGDQKTVPYGLPSPAEGSLIVGDDVPKWASKTVGSNGQILVADDSQPGGMKWAHDVHSMVVEIPTPNTDDTYLIRDLPYNVTFVELYCHVVTGDGTVSFNVERRARAASGSSGTSITDSPIEATTTGAATTSFANDGDGDADEWLILDITETTDTPTLLRLTIRYQRR